MNGHNKKYINQLPSVYYGVAVLCAILAFCALVIFVFSILGQNSSTIVTSMKTWQILVILSVLLFLCSQFIKLYLLKNRPCEAEDTCAVNKMKRNNRIMLWIGTLALLIILSLINNPHT